MALQLGALRDALEAAQGVPPELARKAAEEVAGYEQRFVGLEGKIDAFERKVDQRFASVDVRFAMLDGKLDKVFWAITTIGALTLLTLGKVWFG